MWAAMKELQAEEKSLQCSSCVKCIQDLTFFPGISCSWESPLRGSEKEGRISSFLPSSSALMYVPPVQGLTPDCSRFHVTLTTTLRGGCFHPISREEETVAQGRRPWLGLEPRDSDLWSPRSFPPATPPPPPAQFPGRNILQKVMEEQNLTE